MNRSNKYSWLSKLPIVAVYLLFFTVQIFYNLDTNRRIFNTQRSVSESYSHRSEKTLPSVITASAHSHTEHSLWLNKRYEPSTVPMPVISVRDIAVLRFEKLTIGTDVIQFYFSVLLSAYGLRGPPAVA